MLPDDQDFLGILMLHRHLLQKQSQHSWKLSVKQQPEPLYLLRSIALYKCMVDLEGGIVLFQVRVAILSIIMVISMEIYIMRNT